MAMHNDPDHPWVFQRDEIDLLEEDIEEIYQRFEKNADFIMENSVIQEQLETEEFSDAEFTVMLAEEFAVKKAPKIPEFRLDEKYESTQGGVQEARRSPLYDGAFIWSSTVFGFAKEVYDQNGPFAHNAFRVYLNAKMIPIKLSIIHVDELNDEFSLDVAEKEFDLASVYINRVLESLSGLVSTNPDIVAQLILRGERLNKIVQETIALIKKRKQRGSGSFL